MSFLVLGSWMENFFSPITRLPSLVLILYEHLSPSRWSNISPFRRSATLLIELSKEIFALTYFFSDFRSAVFSIALVFIASKESRLDCLMNSFRCGVSSQLQKTQVRYFRLTIGNRMAAPDTRAINKTAQTRCLIRFFFIPNSFKCEK